MRPPVALRRMEPGDIDRVLEIASGLREAPRWQREDYRKAVDSQDPPRRAALVAKGPDGVIAGFAVAGIAAPEAELETIGVAVARQRQGAGRALLQALEDALQQAGVETIFLEVRPSNRPAIALYGSLGFRVAGRRPGYYAGPVEDALLMRKEIARVGPATNRTGASRSPEPPSGV